MTRGPDSGDHESLEVFQSVAVDPAPRDAQDLMAYPWFSLSKTKRTEPIDFKGGDIVIRVEGTAEHGIATIWDADVLIWAASQIVEARDAGLRTSRLIATSPHEILRYIRRGTSVRDYRRLKAALDRLQSTTVATSIRQAPGRRLHRFSWINEWKERSDSRGKPLGMEIILPDWFYSSILSESLILTIDRRYFQLSGGIERWLYRIVRKHAGRQRNGWRFDFRHLHAKSGSHARYSDFALDLRRIAAHQPLPGYRLAVERPRKGVERLAFWPTTDDRAASLVKQLALAMRVHRPVNKP